MSITVGSWKTLRGRTAAAWLALMTGACAPESAGPAPSSPHGSSTQPVCVAPPCAAGQAGRPAPVAGTTAAPGQTSSTPTAGAMSPPLTPGPGMSTMPPSSLPNATAGRGGQAGGQMKPTQAGGSAAGSGAGGAGAGTGIAADELEMLRDTCVAEINMYRAMLPSLKPLKRASAAQEMCSDQGAQMDGDSMVGHGSFRAGLCARQGFTSEDSCPGYPVGGFSGAKTVADALKGCLKAMWAEGEPPVSRAMCMQDLSGCYEKHGHYLNMSDTGIGSVACSFYKMKNGQYWMNQDFSR